MYPAVVPEDSCGIFRHALSGAGLIFPHHRPRILAAPEIGPGIITTPLSNEPGFSYIGSDQDTPRDKTGPRLFLHTTFPIFDCVSDTPARLKQARLLLPSLIRTLASPKILRLGIIKPSVCFCARLFVHWLAPKILSLGKMQASLLLPSLIRIFGSALDTSASGMLK